MRVAMYYTNRDVRLEELPKPWIGPGEVLIRIKASGLCGSDVMEWYRRHKAPLVLGHEVAGEIAEVGDGVTQYKVGDRVAVSHHVPCNTCHYCLSGHHTVCDTLRSTNFDPGGFAEFVRVPQINTDRGIYRIPDEVSYEDATFTEPLACVLRGLRKTGFEQGDSVLVIGSGIAGILYIDLARALGAGRIMATDIADCRLEAAGRFGAHSAFHASEDVPTRVREVNGGRGADRVILTSGALPAVDQALRSVERSGSVLFFAPTDEGATFPLSINDLFWRNDTTLTTSYAGSPADHETALRLIRAGSVHVKEMITHRFGLEEAGKGFALVAAGSESIKVIIEP